MNTPEFMPRNYQTTLAGANTATAPHGPAR